MEEKKRGINGPKAKQQKAQPAFGKIILGKRNFSKYLLSLQIPWRGLEDLSTPWNQQKRGDEGIQTEAKGEEEGEVDGPCSCLNSMSQLSDLQYEPPQCMIFAIVCILPCTRLARTDAFLQPQVACAATPEELDTSQFLPLSILLSTFFQKRANPIHRFVYIHAKSVKFGEFIDIGILGYGNVGYYRFEESYMELYRISGNCIQRLTELFGHLAQKTFLPYRMCYLKHFGISLIAQ